jgi:protein-tyrosine phosphatase
MIENWIETVKRENIKGKRNVLVFSKSDFKKVADKVLQEIPDQVAFISIEGTPDCIKYWLESEKGDFDNDHYLSPGPHTLNLEFDDLTEDQEYKGHLFKTITQEQADQIVEFVEKNLDRNIIIHCKAGKSRSQAVARFILDFYSDSFTMCEENRNNPCISPNIEVISKLKKAIWRKGGNSLYM